MSKMKKPKGVDRFSDLPEVLWGALPPAKPPLSPSRSPQRFIAIGLDFGTTFSGISWAYSGDPDNIKEIRAYPSINHQERDEVQVPTQFDLVSQEWGYRVPEESVPVRWFKLLLLKNEDIRDEIRHSQYLQDARDQMERYGKDVVGLIADYLKRLWEHALKEIRKGIDIDDLPFKVGITIPAIWPQYARTMMRQAARQAGILQPRDIGETTLILVEEPEAAALATLWDRRDYPELQSDESFIVCDCGGGTVDIISYRVASTTPFVFNEIVKGEGKLCGAFLIDDAFEQYMRMKSGLKFDNIQANEFRLFVSREWETTLKRAFSGENDPDSFILRPPARSLSKLKRLKGLSDRYEINKATVERFFAKPLAGIRELISEQWRRIQETQGKAPKRILLVGGLGCSDYIYTNLQRQFKNVLRPDRPWSAVARGTVIKLVKYGVAGTVEVDETIRKRLAKFPEVHSRISRLSYGTESGHGLDDLDPPFNPELDEIWIDPDGDKCVLRVDWYLKQGEAVNNKNPVELSYTSWVYDITDPSVGFSIITSDKEVPPPRTDNSTRELCEISCEIDTPLSNFPLVKGVRRISGTKMTMSFEGEPQFEVVNGNSCVKQSIQVEYT